MIVTTSLKETEQLIKEAKEVAKQLELSFIERNDLKISAIQKYHCSDVLVVGTKRLSIYQEGDHDPLFFHPNSAMFRVKRILRGESDPFLKATKLTENMSILDCTLGLASDSILSSVVVGKFGQVVGIEGNPYLAFIVKRGLANWNSALPEMDEAMKRIQVKCMNHLDFLRNEQDNAFDVVYFDPMFESLIDASDGINPLRKMALNFPINDEIIFEAKRVAKMRVVLKDHWQSSRFRQFGFHVYKRPTSLFHYASIEL